MINYQTSVHLDQSIEKVFAFVVDPSNLRNWQSNLIENDQLSQDQLHIGTHFHEVRRMGRRSSEVQAEITDFQPNKVFATKTLSGPPASITYNFTPEENGTKLSYQFKMQTRGMMRLLEPMITASIKRDSEADLESLKRIIENPALVQ
jgi:uncharacterized protein YndB with AHSA1/START domain